MGEGLVDRDTHQVRAVVVYAGHISCRPAEDEARGGMIGANRVMAANPEKVVKAKDSACNAWRTGWRRLTLSNSSSSRQDRLRRPPWVTVGRPNQVRRS
ncbi:hypothetical protein [Microbispora sp. NPDC046933]|uniref:hypothetical protein n=1 Tax=Microbispora sp. NPDC046933 TaxID=3155618 RepID=UPI0033D0F9CF